MSDTFPGVDQIRSSWEVAERALALFAVIGLGFRAPRSEVLPWLQQNDLWVALSPREVGFVDNPWPSRQAVIDATWSVEALVVLLWALGQISQLPPADGQCDTSVFRDLLPPYSEIDVREFIQSSKLRSDRELWDFADECLRLHWEARDAKLKGKSPRVPVDIEIIQERHKTINWITGYEDAPWDDVTTDT